MGQPKFGSYLQPVERLSGCAEEIPIQALKSILRHCFFLRPLLRRSYGLQIGNHRLGVGVVHPELGHRGA